MPQVEIGKAYQEAVQEAISLYKQGRFEDEKKLVDLVNGLYNPIGCYSCLKRIEERHILIENNGERIRFHKRCIDKLAEITLKAAR